ncbi:DUF4125 family protein [Clostridium sp. OF09-36]|uniref:DUF4125 family protein n=1 Tax=Clostridium sp. OF09-36 TaxID=2292310 RepID=UPI0015FB480E|nr:DUF4125 family protein [Clostridium sp. OF09-36]
MRRSQFVVWDRVSLESYRNDLQQAEKQGRNLLTEKYAYMMQDTCPEEYQKIEKELPVLSAEKQKLVSELTELQTRWMERFHESHPLFGSQGRQSGRKMLTRGRHRWRRMQWESYRPIPKRPSHV